MGTSYFKIFKKTLIQHNNFSGSLILSINFFCLNTNL